VVSFPFLFTWWQFCIVQILFGPKTFLHISSVFLPILNREFSFFSFFCFLSLFDWKFYLFAFFRFFDRELSFLHFLLRARFMVSWDFGSRLVEWLDMVYVRVWPAVQGQRGCPTLFPWYTCNNDDLEILCKTSHVCTHVDTQVSSFYGHVMLGLRIHFLYLSQPNVSKICSFINSCIHPSLFWAFGKIFIAFTLQVYSHFFQKLVMIIENFCKEKLEVISFQKHVGFLI